MPTQSLRPEEIENIDHIEAIFLTLELTSWDPYNGAYEEGEENFLDRKGGIIYLQQQRSKLFDDQDVCEITVSDERHDEAINQYLY